MSPTSVSPPRGNGSPILSARMAELVQYMGTPLLGRLTDEQRSLSLAIARRLVTNVARHIDADMDMAALWGDWTRDGIPVTEEFARACFTRAEEHRWRVATEHSALTVNLNNQRGNQHVAARAGDIWPNHALAAAYQQFQLADRRRFDAYGYPALGITDISDNLFRHLLNEIARWRLEVLSADRKSSAGLGDAVRYAWQQKTAEKGIDAAAQDFFHQLLNANLLYDYLNEAILRHEWPSFLALASVAQAQRYADMSLFFMTATPDQWAKILNPLRVSDAAKLTLEEAIMLLPARASASDGWM